LQLYETRREADMVEGGPTLIRRAESRIQRPAPKGTQTAGKENCGKKKRRKERKRDDLLLSM